MPISKILNRKGFLIATALKFLSLRAIRQVVSYYLYNIYIIIDNKSYYTISLNINNIYIVDTRECFFYRSCLFLYEGFLIAL